MTRNTAIRTIVVAAAISTLAACSYHRTVVARPVESAPPTTVVVPQHSDGPTVVVPPQ